MVVLKVIRSMPQIFAPTGKPLPRASYVRAAWRVGLVNWLFYWLVARYLVPFSDGLHERYAAEATTGNALLFSLSVCTLLGLIGFAYILPYCMVTYRRMRGAGFSRYPALVPSALLLALLGSIDGLEASIWGFAGQALLLLCLYLFDDAHGVDFGPDNLDVQSRSPGATYRE